MINKRLERKRTILNWAEAIIYAILIIFCIYIIAAYKKPVKPVGQVSYKNYTVQEKETLFDIANKLDKDEDLRKTVNDIKELNNLKSSMIYQGQVIKIEVK